MYLSEVLQRNVLLYVLLYIHYYYPHINGSRIAVPSYVYAIEERRRLVVRLV